MVEMRSNKSTERITVYTPPELKKEMEEFARVHNFGSASTMLKRGYSILKQVMVLNGVSPTGPSLREQLETVIQKLEEIQLERSLNKQQEIIIEGELDKISPKDIPGFKIISSKILDLIDEFDGIKDIVLMDHLREEYSEGIIWAVLVKLNQKGTIKLIAGEWKRK